MKKKKESNAYPKVNTPAAVSVGASREPALFQVWVEFNLRLANDSTGQLKYYFWGEISNKLICVGSSVITS